MFNPLHTRTLQVSGEALPVWGGAPVLVPVRLTGTEALGKLYEYALDVATVDDPTLRVWEAQELIVPDTLIGKVVTISIEFSGNGTFLPGLLDNTGTANTGAGIRRISGLLTAVQSAGADDRHAYYRFIVRPWLWLATRNRESRIFQNISVIDITQQLLKAAYPFPIELRLGSIGLKSGYPVRDFVRQFWQSDFEFLTMLWREWGLYYFFDELTLILCDSPGSQRKHGNAYDTIRYHAPDGTRIEEEHIHKINVSRKLTAGNVSLIDYDYTRSRAQLTASKKEYSETAFENAEHYASGDYSQPQAGTMGLTGEPNDCETEAGYLARVRMDAIRCRSLRLRGRGNLRGLTTGKTLWLTDHPQKKINAEYLVIATTLDIRNAGKIRSTSVHKPQYQCVTDFVLQPADTFFRNRLKKKPRCGGETAVVVGPENQPMWVDGYARIKIQFVWDRLGNKDQNSSCWVRVSSPWQGDGFGALYLPRIGQEVTVNYHEGDPDKPYVSARMVNQFNQPPWELPKNQALTGTRTRDLEGKQSNHFVADDTPGQLQVQAASDHAQSRLVLGYNTRIEGNKGRQEARGVGWELATDSWGVARAGRGMLITTEKREGATVAAKDMGETLERLTEAQYLHKNLAQLALQHKAQQNEASQNDATKAIQDQNNAIRGNATGTGNPFPQLAEPHMVLASAAGIGITAAQSTHIASNLDLAATTGRDVSISSGRSLFATVRGAVSIFAYRLGMKLVAAKGKVELQAQSDEMALSALKDITITSSDGRIILNAAKEVWIGAGGSYLRINGNLIENCTHGQILERSTAWEKQGPTGAHRQKQAFFESQQPLSYSQRIFLDTVFNNPAGISEPVKYRFIDETGETLGIGMIDDSGNTLRAFTASPQPIKTVFDLNHGKWTTLSYRDSVRIVSNETDKTDAGVFDYADHQNGDDSAADGDSFS
ncbi:type VI secretion system Vgr family protein [Paraburkholderia fungorum]|uniref:type VI secretion system Vgr family protein n=1 Tax=Paraburkholderia fungorum TaxID=134537 RepID=UPI0038B71753